MVFKKKYTVGVIGLGVGAHHLKAFEQNINTEVKIICDLDKKVINKFKKRYPKKIFTSNSNLIFKDNAIDIVAIASNDNYHYQHIISAFKNNKNIFVEKPICLNKSQLKKIITLSKKNPKIKISSNMVLRSNPRFKLLKQKINKNIFNNIYYAQADYLWGRPFKLSGWRSKISEYSIILGASIHMIDIIIWLLSKRPTHVQAFSNRIGSSTKMIKSETFSSINLFFKNGLIVNINSHGLSVHPHFHTLRIYGDKATFIQEENGAHMFVNSNNTKKIMIKSPYPFKENRHEIIDQFIKHLLKNKNNDSFVSFKEIVELMSICFSAIESNKQNKKIKIRYY